MTMRLKGCRRCGGDLHLEGDIGGYKAWVCIQCGHEQGNNGVTQIKRPCALAGTSTGYTTPKRGMGAGHS